MAQHRRPWAYRRRESHWQNVLSSKWTAFQALSWGTFKFVAGEQNAPVGVVLEIRGAGPNPHSQSASP